MKSLFFSKIKISTPQKVTIKNKQAYLRRTGVERETAAQNATILTVTPPTPNTRASL